MKHSGELSELLAVSNIRRAIFSHGQHRSNYISTLGSTFLGLSPSFWQEALRVVYGGMTTRISLGERSLMFETFFNEIAADESAAIDRRAHIPEEPSISFFSPQGLCLKYSFETPRSKLLRKQETGREPFLVRVHRKPG